MAERFRGVRARTTVIATAVVAAALAIALVVIGLVTRSRLITAIEASAVSRAEAVAGLVEAGAAVDPLPGRDPELLAQVISPEGAVIAADRAATGLAPFSTLRPGPGVTRLIRVEAPAGIVDDDALPETGRWVLAVRGTTTGASVVVGAPLDDATDVFGAALGVVGAGVLAVLAVVAAATWLLTGRALRPVDRMRAEADQISEHALDRRLAVPGGGDEISRLAVTLNQMLSRLDEAAAARRRFVADASHELRSPVTALRAMLDVTGDRVPDPGLLAAIGTEVARLEQLVADLLALARSDGPTPARVAEVDVDQALHDEAGAMRHRSSRLVDTSGVEAARALVDPDAVARIVRNLADNALRHARTTVWLTSRVSEGMVVIGVDDDGAGIARDDRERVFDRLVRLDPARDRTTGGSGLGLSVVRALARDAGGDARFVDSRRGGASAEVRLPAAPD